MAELKIEADDRVLEVCCGAGGTLSLITSAALVVGIDISWEAARFAARRCGSRAKVIQANAYRLPFADGAFTRVVAQEGDAWLHQGKKQLMAEISRVTASGGRFVYQTYARARDVPGDIEQKTRRIMEMNGFAFTEVPIVDDLAPMLEASGFRIERVKQLHEVYQRDNRRMIVLWKQNRREMYSIGTPVEVNGIGALLSWERKLFREHWWTGVRVIGTKA